MKEHGEISNFFTNKVLYEYLVKKKIISGEYKNIHDSRGTFLHFLIEVNFSMNRQANS